MITLPGRLAVRTIHGRNGPFNVGRLATSIGEFVIKDPQLDQFQEGQFSGEFLVLEIRPASYFASGRLVVEVRAKVGEMMLTEDGMLVTPHGDRFDSSEIDPIEEEVNTQPPSTVSAPLTPPAPPQSEDVEPFGIQPQEQPAPKVVSQETSEDSTPDAELFGLLWPLDQSVKLDPTVGRTLFRQQVSRIKELGYRFQASTQTWHIAA